MQLMQTDVGLEICCLGLGLYMDVGGVILFMGIPATQAIMNFQCVLSDAEISTYLPYLALSRWNKKIDGA